MTRADRIPLPLLFGCAFLASCGSDKSASGGTGSDFPIHPAIAIVQELKGATVQAAAWRLWSVADDSVRYRRELSSTDGGFILPDTGSWLVEAWSSSTAAGKTNDLSSQASMDTYERCLNWIGRNTTSTSPSPAVLGACSDLQSPTVLAHGSSQGAPRAIAAFRLPSPDASAFTVRDSNGIVKARAWRLWKATPNVNAPFTEFVFAGYQSGGEPGVIETSGLSGTWVAQGWIEAPSDTLYRTPPFKAGLESTLVDLCLGTSPDVPPRVCNEQLFEGSQYGSAPGQLAPPHVQVVFRIPAVR